ncbi:MAG: hypothetical protein WD824_00265 [Cyclobacteriaceae bacterium]
MDVILWFLHIALIFVIGLRVYKKQPALRKFFWPALSFKLFAGVCLGLVYTYFYTVADTFDYFRDASELASLAREDLSAYFRLIVFDENIHTLNLVFDQPRAVLLTKITSVFNLLTGNNYWVIGFYFSLISFLASWNLVQNINRYIPSVGLAAAIAFLFLPSVVFWTSGILKESIAMACLCYLSALFLRIWFNEKPTVWQLLLSFISLWFFWNLKYYYAAVFVPVIITSMAYKFLIAKKFASSPGREMFVWVVMFILPLVAVTFLHPNFHFDRLLDVIVSNNQGYNELSAPEDVVHFNHLRATPMSLLRNAPWALFSGLFRPLFWEVSSFIQFLQGMENTLILVLLVAASFRYKRYFSSPHRVLMMALIVYVILLCIFLTLSAPNFGTLSRYRMGYLSFFVFIILCNNPIVDYLERSLARLVSH